MADITDQLEVKHEWHLKRLLFLGLVAIGILVSAAAIPLFTDFRSRAKPPIDTSIFQGSVRPTPPTDLISPYLRLVVAEANYKVGETVSVDIYLSTSNKLVMEAVVSLVYPVDTLTLQKDNIVQSDVFKSFQVNSLADGAVVLDYFVTPSVGHQAVVIQGEEKIGTLKFTVIGKSDLISLDILNGKPATESSRLIQYAKDREASPSNLLQAVRGVSFQTE